MRGAQNCGSALDDQGSDGLRTDKPQDLVFEARRQGPGGFIDDLIAHAHDWGFAVEDIRVPTRIMAAQRYLAWNPLGKCDVGHS
jgi:hypothetical protein